MDRFERALPKILIHEGGFVDHPRDPGGATNFGITQNTYNSWLRSEGQQQRSVREITKQEVQQIYREDFWNSIRADNLPDGVAYCVFDAAVNSGPARAVRWLQTIVGARVDGVVGNETLSLTRQYDPVKLINAYCDKRLAFMRRLSHWSTFGRGWTRRVEEVRSQALEWASGGSVRDSLVEAPGKADMAPQKPSQSGEVKGGVTTIAGSVGVALSELAETLEPISYYSEYIMFFFVTVTLAGAMWTIYSRYVGED